MYSYPEIFIHHDIAESFLIFFQNIGKLTEQQNGFINQIVKIQGIVALECSLVFAVDLGYFFLVKISSCIHLHLIRCDHLVLGMGDLCKKRPLLVFLGVDI